MNSNMPKPRTLQQNKTIHSLLNKAGIDDDLKRQMVVRITSGRTTSTKEMYFAEANQLIAELNGKPHDSSRRTQQAIRKKAGVITMAQRSQLDLIESLGRRFFDAETGLSAWITKRIGHYPARTSKEAQSCIEALKQMVRRKQAA